KQTPSYPPGWKAACQRDEIRPTFSFESKGGPNGHGAFVIAAADSVGQHGWFQKVFPLTGGRVYRFQAVRKAEAVAVPRRGGVAWSDVTFAETPPPPSRKVRLATVHYVPSGKSPRANCEEYAPLLAEAAKQKADLVVLGETVPYVRVGKKPHETAEAIPGPTTAYFGGLAKEHGLHVAVSLYERAGKVVYNACVLLGPDGKLIG